MGPQKMTPQNQKFMQLTMSPMEHVQSLMKPRRFFRSEYWASLPTYIISRCPLCSTTHTGKLDVHSQGEWSARDSDPGVSFYSFDHEQGMCSHHIAVQQFLHLEGHLPSETERHEIQLHVPFVADFLVPLDIPSAVAVMHSFAICRLEDGHGRVFDYINLTFIEPLQTEEAYKERWRLNRKPKSEISAEAEAILKTTAVFVPRYTVYAMSYYAAVEDHQLIKDRRMKPQQADWERDPEYEPVWMAAMGEAHSFNGFDLPYWVEQGKLQWLDIDNPELPLKSGPVEAFPYVNIPFDRGHRYRMQFYPEIESEIWLK